ncbi:protein disulfide oxidoreductase [Pantoea sp. A4]|uniref:protein disulfide oxidoreductase n=1 Tax=Pantoea sp. A4 TaxID=1225184 RepID=UPI00035C358D|nr:protein disulfide oxidoreductase [Pantoea sp. A4]
MKRLKRLLREGVLLLLLLASILWGLDLWRAPKLTDQMLTQSLMDMNGESLSLQAISQQQPVLIYVWATWCGVCKLTTPTVAALSAEGVPVLSVALRSGDDDRVTEWMRKKTLPQPGLNDERGELAQHWGINVTPTFVVIYRGEVKSVTTGWSSRWGLQLRMWLAKQ